MINHSLVCGYVPQSFKIAQVTPLLKKEGLDICEYKNYRPVSNLCFIGKVLEKVVASQLNSYLAQHGLHDMLQSAYKAGHSTETAVIKIKSDMDQILDQGDGILLVLLDLSAAFDTIDHNILFHRLEHCVGVKGTALQWLKSYLSDRQQTIRIGSSFSSHVPLSVGVPQGSVLGPLLFLIYILPLGSIIEKHKVDRHGYADDTQLYCRFSLKDKSTLEEVITRMELCIAEVSRWMLSNKLKLNDAKTECMLIASRNKISILSSYNLCLTVGQAHIKPKMSVRNLGAVLDAELSMEKQVNSVIQGIHFHLRRISKIRPNLDKATCEKLIHSVITSRLDYHNGLLLGLSEKLLNRLQIAQNNAARLLTGSRRHDHIKPVLFHLHWLPVKQRIAFKILLIIHKSVHAPNAPLYLRNQISLYIPSRSLHSADDPWRLHVPRSFRKYGAHSLSVGGARLWNTLPSDIREPVSLYTFKRKLKTLLFNQAFK
jgi:hypothetical protein